jgi:hypothetical protein
MPGIPNAVISFQVAPFLKNIIFHISPKVDYSNKKQCGRKGVKK